MHMLDDLVYTNIIHTLHACGIRKTNPVQLYISGTVNFDRESFKSV